MYLLGFSSTYLPRTLFAVVSILNLQDGQMRQKETKPFQKQAYDWKGKERSDPFMYIDGSHVGASVC